MGWVVVGYIKDFLFVLIVFLRFCLGRSFVFFDFILDSFGFSGF